MSETSVYNLTAPVVMTFPNLHEPRAFGPKGKETGEKKYSANFLFNPDSVDLKQMKALAAKIAHEKWPGRNVSELCLPFTDGNKLADQAREAKKNGEFNRGKTVMAARSQYEPRLSGIENGVAVDYEGDARKAAKGKFYPGVEVLAQFNFVAYKGVGRNPDGVTAYLNMVFTTGKGTRLGGGAPASQVFSAYIGAPSNHDPIGIDDEIQF